MRTDWRDALVDWQREAVPHVLVTVIEAVGSTPREAGVKMVVSMTDQAGGIGGGNLEFQAAATARKMLDHHESQPIIEKVMLGPDLGQCCGGGATLLFEPLSLPEITLALFGAGHVGTALVRVLAGTGVRVLWFDPRPESFPVPLPPGVTMLTAPHPEAEVASLPAGCRALVMTHSHDLDFSILDALLRRNDLASLGLIGSDSKWARFKKRLVDAGIPADKVATVACPIGLPNVGGKRPAEIAIATAAWLLLKEPE
jgi:xanthine dehydrogenase accessory factor